MAKLISTKVDIAPVITLELTEDEALALAGIFGYSVDHFLRVFYEKMGTAYVKPHEKGVRSLHETIRKATTPALAAIQQARRVLHDGLVKTNKTP